MLRITRVTDLAITTLIVSGRIGAEQVPSLREIVEAERVQEVVVLDLTEVSLVDVEAVRFLVQCETRGIHLKDCPGYVREWMRHENRPP